MAGQGLGLCRVCTAGSGRKEQFRDAIHQRYAIYHCFLPPSKDPTITITERPWGGGGDAYVDPSVQGRLQDREERLFTSTSLSTHSLLVLPFSVLSDGYQSPGKCKRGEVDTELIFASFLKGGRCRDPLCQ